MSAVVQSGAASGATQSLPLLASDDPQRTLIFSGNQRMSSGRFVAQALALAAQPPAGRDAVNLCEDRHQFLLAFCAVALAGQTNLLPTSRAPQAVADVLRAYPASYAISDRAGSGVAHCFRMPPAQDWSASAVMDNPSIRRLP